MDESASNRIEELIRERLRLDLELERRQQLLTILFVDVVGSTCFYDEHGNTAGLVMVQKCLDLLIPVIEHHGGIIVKTVGDAILARFNKPEAAVRCAVQMERNLARHNTARATKDQIHIHVGVNYGLALLKENDVFGDVVNVTARIESAAAADEIVISPSVYEQIRHLPDIRVRKKASSVKLKGKAGKLDLYSVAWPPEETAGPAPPPPSADQLAKATGLHTGLADITRGGARGPVPDEPPAIRRGSPAPGKTSVLGAGEVEKAVPPAVRFALARVREDGSLGERHALDRPGMTVGGRGDIRLPFDPSSDREHARFTQLGDALYVEDLSSPQGVFLRLRAPHCLRQGDIILMGQQKLRFEVEVNHPDSARGSSAKQTAVLGASLAPATAHAALVRLDANLRETDRFNLRVPETLFGRSKGTYAFPEDPFLSTTHARIELQQGQFFLEDLGSTNGTFVRIRKRALARTGDTLMIEGQILRVL